MIILEQNRAIHRSWQKQAKTNLDSVQANMLSRPPETNFEASVVDDNGERDRANRKFSLVGTVNLSM